MKQFSIAASFILLLIAIFFNLSFKSKSVIDYQELREIYSKTPSAWPNPSVDEGIVHQELGLLPEPTFPKENPYSKEKAQLGKLLFFDPRLSKSGQIACASCHDSELGWGDGRKGAYGHNRRRGKRNASTLLNVAFVKDLFWDGRAHSLEHQAFFPIQDTLEMNTDLAEMVNTLSGIKGYNSYFSVAFGDEKVTLERISQALATYHRTIKSRASKFDLFLKGRKDILSDEELLGLHLFRTKARCINCHNGPLFSDNEFHNDGFTFFGRPEEDLGRYWVTNDPKDVGAFRTPSLRDVQFTGPWMHTGTMADLDEIIDMYNLGMPQPIPKSAQDRPLLPKSSPLLKKLDLTSAEKKALKAVLGAISARPYPVKPPELPQ